MLASFFDLMQIFLPFLYTPIYLFYIMSKAIAELDFQCSARLLIASELPVKFA